MDTSGDASIDLHYQDDGLFLDDNGNKEGCDDENIVLHCAPEVYMK